jgi:hypothetical protein
MKNEAQNVLSKGQVRLVSLDPDTKDQINKSNLETLVREARTHLLKRRKVHMIVVKE